MKILLIHQHFNTPQTGGALRSYYLAKALADRGIEVTVITGHNDKIYRHQPVDGIDVHYLPVAYENRFGFARRSTSFIKFVVQGIRVSRRWKDIDYCYAISVPLTVGLIATWLKTFRKIPFIFEVGDLWPDAPIQLGVVHNYFFKKFLYGLERFIYKRAYALVALSPSIAESINGKVGGKTIHLIPNMADCEYYFPAQKDPATQRKYDVEGKFVVSYIGAVGLANGLDYFIECANHCRKANRPIHFLLCGTGALAERLKSSAERLGLRNITFLGPLDRAGVKEVLSVTDAAFVCYKNVPILETGSPNKFFDGLAAGKLIIVNFGGWIRKEVEQYRCGLFVNPNQPAEFEKKIGPFLNDPVLLSDFQKASRSLGEQKYSRVLLAAKFAAIFK